MKIIVGLGNPGDKYKNTRHNAGFMALDALAEKLEIKFKASKKFNAETAEAGNMMLVKPQGYMNVSGRAVSGILSYYKLLPKKLGLLKSRDADLSELLIVVHDDLDIELGKYKEAVDSRSAGHNGVQSIIDHLKTKNFRRLRLGIKTSRLENVPAEKYVLENFNADEMDSMRSTIYEVVKTLSG